MKFKQLVLSAFLLASIVFPLWGQQYSKEMFTGLFEDKNVGSLHLYIQPRKTHSDTETSYLKGKAIKPAYNSYLPQKVRPWTSTKECHPKAIFAIRANGLRNFYLIEVPQKQADEQLILYQLQQRKLKKVKVLASYGCKAQNCIQLDSWVSDLNGDGRLDLIQKRHRKSKNGKESTQTSVYLLNRQGKFKRTRKIKLKEEDYTLFKRQKDNT